MAVLSKELMFALPGLLLMARLMAGTPQEAQKPSPEAAHPEIAQPAGETGADIGDPDGDLPVSMDRIRRKLSEPPVIKVDKSGTVFRVAVVGRKLTIEDILGPDYLKGPVPAGAPTHQEILDLVTPKDVQGYAAFSNGEALTVAATSIALQWALMKAIHKFQEAREERAREAARKEVQEALAELEKARAKAGLPPK